MPAAGSRQLSRHSATQENGRPEPGRPLYDGTAEALDGRTRGFPRLDGGRKLRARADHLEGGTAHDSKLGGREELRWNTADGNIAWIVTECLGDLVPAKEGRGRWQDDQTTLRLRQCE